MPSFIIEAPPSLFLFSSVSLIVFVLGDNRSCIIGGGVTSLGVGVGLGDPLVRVQLRLKWDRYPKYSPLSLPLGSFR